MCFTRVLLPNADKAQIDERKLSGYLLSPTHPVGRFKASFFFAMGFDQDGSESLRGELLRIAGSFPAQISRETRHGITYLVRGTLEGPAGRRAELDTLWMIRSGTAIPHFVTAYPS